MKILIIDAYEAQTLKISRHIRLRHVSDADIPRTRVEYATWRVHFFTIFCIRGHIGDTSQTHVSFFRVRGHVHVCASKIKSARSK